MHSDCAELCRDFAFGECSSSHQSSSPDFEDYYSVVKGLEACINGCGNPEKREGYKKDFDEILENHLEYVAHLVCTKHQSDYYSHVTTNLKPGEIVIIIDYKMKPEMGKRLRENQREWYGKRGISIHGFFVMAQVSICILDQM